MKQSGLQFIRVFGLMLNMAVAALGQESLDPQLVIYNEVKQLIESRYGNGYDFGYTIFDSVIQYSRGGMIQDPYGTLKGCVLYSAYLHSADSVPDNFIVGMVKNGQIIWDDSPGSTLDLEDGDLNGNLLFAQDINNDGEVDLIYAENLRINPTDLNPSISYIEILSWNGSRGKVISDDLPTNGTCELINPNDDGVLEIRTSISNADAGDEFKTSTYPYVTYGWNGTRYGLWSGIKQYAENEFLPANHFHAGVECLVSTVGGNLKYSYSASNDSKSVQAIETIYIMNAVADTVMELAPAGWVAGVSRYTGRTFFYDDAGHEDVVIKPGETASGFSFESPKLPSIVKYYLQGYTGGVTCCPTDEDERQNVFTNSVTGFTLGTRDTTVTMGTLQQLDTLTSYTTQSRSLGWIKDQATADKYSGYFASAKTNLQQNNTTAARATLQQILQQVNIDSTSNLTSEAYALIRYNTEYLLTQLPTSQPSFIVKLISSTGTRLTTGSLQYYESSWKDATNNNDGTFTINTTAKTLSLRMTYEYGTQTKYNVTVGADTAVFQTVSTSVQLKNSQGNAIDTGTVQYYAGAWRVFGTTTNGVSAKELLPNTYSFRMIYVGGSNDKAQDIGTNPAVVFQTVNTTVQLKNSQGNMIDQGTVQYYAGAWRSFGTTSGGVIIKELLPANYSFRMTYEGVPNDKALDISQNSSVVFSTVLCTITVKNSQGQPVDNVQASYYSGAWRQIGSTVNGQATKELLPANLTFRITHGTNHQDKTQNLATNSLVEFTTP